MANECSCVESLADDSRDKVGSEELGVGGACREYLRATFFNAEASEVCFAEVRRALVTPNSPRSSATLRFK